MVLSGKFYYGKDRECRDRGPTEYKASYGSVTGNLQPQGDFEDPF